jgi:hypothetical protein
MTAIALFVTYYSWSSAGIDARVYWRAAAMLLNDGWASVYQVQHHVPFKYHPAFAMIFAPLGLLTPRNAVIAWAVLNGVLVFDLQRRWRRSWNLDAIDIAVGFLCISHAVAWQCDFGNVTFAMLWLWTVALTSRRLWVQGFCYALLIALKPWWGALLVPWMLCRRRDLAAPVTASLVGLSLAPLSFGVGSFTTVYQRWYETFMVPIHNRNFPKPDNQTWYGWIFRQRDIAVDERVLWWVIGCAVVGVVWLWFWRRHIREPLEPDRQWLIELSVVPFMLWAAPLSWIHHQILLWPLLALVAQCSRREWSARGVLLICAVLFSVINTRLLGNATALPLLRAGWPMLGFIVVMIWAGLRLPRWATPTKQQQEPAVALSS